ncbi:DUF3295 domain protein [Metarhizium robertsii]|uniref:DUF3295 domain-containing protein n=2 Tax=Metarhizium robertsii TaxID=568076 RepID=E9FDC2_METRA|nr:uncharacterized protein MAA_10271 [Metarhizium robertsii ARSEF 23]EFY94261.1 hypothetical protein MAA_10271 [Metarhizium robertsii ARSEF 23]EXU95060.1 DUF3295 domain protein [Metarhizium robertsii]
MAALFRNLDLPANPITLYTISNKNCAETRNGEVPGLSHSVESLTGDSLTDAETVGFTISGSPQDRTRIKGQTSAAHEPEYIISGDIDGVSKLTTENKSSSPAPKQRKKQPARFAIGGSSDHPVLPNTRIRNLTAQALQQSESAVGSNTEAEYVDECAIDDDDSSDWEDCPGHSGKSSVDDKFFQRVESKANLASRPSQLTLMLAENKRASTPGNQASQSTPAVHRSRGEPNGTSLGGSPNDSDGAPLMMKGFRHSALKPISEIPRSNAQPITTHAAHVNFPAAFSPRTTRCNMLATELTESLRLNLIWERQQKRSVSKAMLKRRHTSQDVANLQQYPQRACVKPSEDVEIFGWDEFFLMGTFNGYHFKGW